MTRLCVAISLHKLTWYYSCCCAVLRTVSGFLHQTLTSGVTSGVTDGVALDAPWTRPGKPLSFAPKVTQGRCVAEMLCYSGTIAARSHFMGQGRAGNSSEDQRQQEVGRSVQTQVHVIVVDDDEGIRDTLRFLLEDAHYAVTDAKDGAEGLEVLRTAAQPSVVLLDYTMPRLSGPEMLRTVQQESDLHRHRYILLSARRELGDPELRALCESLKVPIVEKPFDMDELLDAVAASAGRLVTSPPQQ